MAVSLPDTFTVNTSERYILSIRIVPDGLSFSGAIPSKSTSFFYRHIALDSSKAYAESLKEQFYEEECLSWPYLKVNIHCFTPDYLFVPEELFVEEKKQDLLDYTFLSPPQKCLVNSLPADKGRILFGIEPEVYEFLCRSYIKPEFIHHMTLPLLNWGKQNQISLGGQMQVLLNKRTIDIACYRRGELVLLNSFACNQIDDVVYFISSVWSQTGLDQLKDRLYVFGEPHVKKELTVRLREYIQYVSDIELPADAYLRNNEIMEAPYDIILSVCE